VCAIVEMKTKRKNSKIIFLLSFILPPLQELTTSCGNRGVSLSQSRDESIRGEREEEDFEQKKRKKSFSKSHEKRESKKGK
jgi:hypothetical protein